MERIAVDPKQEFVEAAGRFHPFTLAAPTYGGGGFFAATLDTTGTKILGTTLEFDATASANFGIASGKVLIDASITSRKRRQMW